MCLTQLTEGDLETAVLLPQIGAERMMHQDIEEATIGKRQLGRALHVDQLGRLDHLAHVGGDVQRELSLRFGAVHFGGSELLDRCMERS